MQRVVSQPVDAQRSAMKLVLVDQPWLHRATDGWRRSRRAEVQFPFNVHNIRAYA